MNINWITLLVELWPLLFYVVSGVIITWAVYRERRRQPCAADHDEEQWA